MLECFKLKSPDLKIERLEADFSLSLCKPQRKKKHILNFTISGQSLHLTFSGQAYSYKIIVMPWVPGDGGIVSLVVLSVDP